MSVHTAIQQNDKPLVAWLFDRCRGELGLRFIKIPEFCVVIYCNSPVQLYFLVYLFVCLCIYYVCKSLNMQSTANWN